ncbi:hypothetical protein [Methyloversatilis sp. XJ19-49]|uniref:hypothetical protein n=1 Tax=Methyloversatilis sp. XJ19-49 TaxID=2963429 RepID=UPI00211BB56A|nr:hypothetical protein [Methyloversatilis sp. XJ19-49]MCQ9380176.1 hypothetical protein [Methyloversatilis sp. XJ19-49]
MTHNDVAYFTRVMAFGGLCLALLRFGAPAAANERATVQACRADARKLCPGMRPGDGRIAICLRQNEVMLSSACQDQLGEVDACKAEARKPSPEAQGEVELRPCAKAKRAELGACCRAATEG